MADYEGQNAFAEKVLKRIDLFIDVLIEDRKLAAEDRKLAAKDRKEAAEDRKRFDKYAMQAEKDRKEMTRAVLLGGNALIQIDKGQKETVRLLKEILRHIKIQGNSHGSNNNK